MPSLARIASGYETFTKDILLAEAGERGITSVNESSKKDEIIAALKADDDSKHPANIPRVESASDRETGIDAGAPPHPEDHKNGVFINKDDGEEYALCKHAANGYGQTHSLKNTRHFWQGKEDEFNAKFSKK